VPQIRCIFILHFTIIAHGKFLHCSIWTINGRGLITKELEKEAFDKILYVSISISNWRSSNISIKKIRIKICVSVHKKYHSIKDCGSNRFYTFKFFGSSFTNASNKLIPSRVSGSDIARTIWNKVNGS
jgi:hypothetical protein